MMKDEAAFAVHGSDIQVGTWKSSRFDIEHRLITTGDNGTEGGSEWLGINCDEHSYCPKVIVHALKGEDENEYLFRLLR